MESSQYLFFLPFITAAKGSLPVWEDGGSKGEEGKTSKCQIH